MHEHNHDIEYERLMLITMIEDFVKFARYLKKAGRISDELYEDITVNKIRFLEESKLDTKGMYRRHS